FPLSLCPTLFPYTTLFRSFAASKLRDWHVLAAIVLPDHLHIIVAPIRNREAKLGSFSAALKRWMREQLGASWRWQAGCFDRQLRSEEHTSELQSRGHLVCR